MNSTLSQKIGLIIAEVKARIEKSEFEAALASIRTALSGSPDYLQQVALARLLDALGPWAKTRLRSVRLAVLGSSTTAQLLPLLRLQGLRQGLWTEIYDAPHGTFQQQILDPASELYRFRPEVALLFVNYRDAGPDSVEAEAERWKQLWGLLQERASCAVIMNNFDTPVERPWGNLDAGPRGPWLGKLRALNQALAEKSGLGVYILDQEHLSSVLGKERWHDPRFWIFSQQAISFDGLARYAQEAAALVAAVLGKSRKCLVVDLDNTIWGGVVGEDGPDGIELDGAFVHFQGYLKALAQRGVLLAACSKNDDAAARAPFSQRSEMVLRLEDFAFFAANWEDKATNLRKIASGLNLGLDALAFADDSAAERELVRRFCPEVAVVDLPEDPAAFTRCLDQLRLFEPAVISGEDLLRTQHFKAEEARERLQRAAPDIAAFLQDLDMRAEAIPIGESDIDRVTQLIQKTNQFNLTSRRYTRAEVKTFTLDPNVSTLAVRLKDRFGDYGLVSVVILRKTPQTMEIDTWLMSCRVFGRQLEHYVFNRLVELSKAVGARSLIADYLPTAKNALIQAFLPSLGFQPSAGGRWTLELSQIKEIPVHIHGNV